MCRNIIFNGFSRFISIASVVVLTILMSVSCSERERYVVISGYAQGGVYTVKANLRGVELRPEAVKDSIDAILLRIDNSISGYNKNSLLSRFNAGETIVPDSIFLNIYDKAWQVYDVTGASVDVAAAPLFDIWGFGFKSGEMPDDDKVRSVRETCCMHRLRRDIRACLSPDGSLAPSALLASGSAPAPQLNYNAIAQGYSCDLVAAWLDSIGVEDMMVDIGEIFCRGFNPSGLPWSLGIDRPVDGNNDPGADLQGIFRAPSEPCGIVTSGNYRKFYIKDGKKYAHTIDPRSGYPVSHSLLSATVVAPDALLADAYATYCMVIGVEAALEFLESDPSLEGCLVYDDAGETRTLCTSGFTLTSPQP